MDNEQKHSSTKERRPVKRRLIQLYAALLYNAHLRGFISGDIYTGNAKAACVPGLNCYSCPAAAGACPLGALQNALSASGKRTGFYVFGIIMLYGLMLGRTICGWLCPVGLIQELLHRIPTPKIPKSRITRALSYLKYVILAVFAAAIPLWYGIRHGMAVPGFCKYICPAGTLEGTVGLLSNRKNADLFGMLGLLFTSKIVIMLIIGLLCIFCYRSFCRFFCPLGALYSLFNRIAVAGVKVDSAKCTGCGKCVRKCRMDVCAVGDRECINCGECMSVCPQNAISLKAGKYTLLAADSCTAAKSRKRQNIARCGALAVLAFAVVWFNFLDPSLRKPAQNGTSGQTGTGVGFEVGCVLEDFEMTCTDGTVFRLSDNRGKVVVINLWATWCGPCVKELPYFEEFCSAHREDAAVLAVHSSFVTDDVKVFLADKNYTFKFAVETDTGTVWDIVNGSNTLPQTIVVDRNGVVVYNQRGSVTPELLESLYY